MSWLITPTEITPLDQDYRNVSLLLHGNGTNGSTTITDNSPTPKTVTAVGNAQISTAQSKFGGASVAFDGNGDYLTTASSSAFDLGSSDFTLESWIYIAANSSPNNDGNRPATIASRIDSSGSATGWTFSVQGNATTTGTGLFFEYALSGVFTTISAATSISQATWHHMAACRSGNTMRLFLNGAVIASQSWSTSISGNNNPLNIGRSPYTNYLHQLNGYIDEFRLTRVARYTSNFTPPTAPFPDAGPAQ